MASRGDQVIEFRPARELHPSERFSLGKASAARKESKANVDRLSYTLSQSEKPTES